ncbi:hypothetical protein BAUCODRAFT_34273 [Baudoinia panamericana UAMH 10762]|uniref:Uncharacterized protein n=1 Tax=Baudoinia panamericana (strain UAMH 10762) TaxID=717646 RepID=M2MFX5_BAUPA|nr:uncharacterized protein BAUCODRAFT_34273 [Baudoinia panamericana UAMH 10762]EMC95516.1 hypothetical protein BAUCODRAFT_34273 [Baudoinia panamericana UAMH 10762]
MASLPPHQSTINRRNRTPQSFKAFTVQLHHPLTMIVQGARVFRDVRFSVLHHVRKASQEDCIKRQS